MVKNYAAGYDVDLDSLYNYILCNRYPLLWNMRMRHQS